MKIIISFKDMDTPREVELDSEFLCASANSARKIVCVFIAESI